MSRILVTLAVAASLSSAAVPQVAPAPGQPMSFAVIGDNGTGQEPQYQVGRQMLKAHAATPFQFVVMVGDNLYGSQQRRDFVDKFEIPYGPLLRMGIPFYAALGNHDQPDNRNYPQFNMSGQRYYSLVKGRARFFFLDTNFLDPKQIEWFDNALRSATEDWKIAVFHHPIYSDGDRHGPDVSSRVLLEPLLVRHGVDVVLSGHEHIYERIKPQKGITYFIVGSSGQLRRGGMTPSAQTAAGFDQDHVFLVASIDGDQLSFQAISRTGRQVDSGVIQRRDDTGGDRAQPSSSR
ncbi:MAG TPA: metallophosphoesterase [Vicinamibacterales bacterium]